MKRATLAVSPQPQRVFGLGIDEKVQWVVADVIGPRATMTDQMAFGTLAIDVAGSSHPAIDIGAAIAEALYSLRDERPELFQGVAALGVSTIGIVKQHALLSLPRKNFAHSSGAALVDFSEVFEDFFSTAALENLTVLNDASAKALVEHNLAREVSNPDAESTLHLMFDEGVNGGIIVGSRPLASLLNPEMGHIRPRLHPSDYDFDFALGQQACPVHGDCFEGIASGARIRHSWGAGHAETDFNISDLPLRHPAWDIIACYIAQLCLIGTLTLSPTQIILGGTVATGREGDEKSYQRVQKTLWPLIRQKYADLNNGYLFYPEMAADDFIRPAKVTADANVVAALQAARLGPFPEVQNQPINLWTTGRVRVIDNAKR